MLASEIKWKNNLINIAKIKQNIRQAILQYTIIY